jgi:hypothetical protein
MAAWEEAGWEVAGDGLQRGCQGAASSTGCGSLGCKLRRLGVVSALHGAVGACRLACCVRHCSIKRRGRSLPRCQHSSAAPENLGIWLLGLVPTSKSRSSYSTS